MARQVLIAGGGFGGFYAARALERMLPAQSAHATPVNEADIAESPPDPAQRREHLGFVFLRTEAAGQPHALEDHENVS